MFIDRVTIKMKSGIGGDGCVSFHRAKYIVNGGPDGGDGGRGGSVIFVGDKNVHSLVDFKFNRKFNAENGANGTRNNCSGKAGSDIFVKVPIGTIVRDNESNKIMLDISAHGEEQVFLKGGRGGRGNQHFATPQRQAPRFAERGRNAKNFTVILELKLIADVGIIGFPNAGKSTLLRMVTNANPKIANYHFTTLSPNLGIVKFKDGNDFVLADIPGLIEGASDGVGLGHYFLRHVERTKALIHVVDASGQEGEDPIEQIEKINKELYLYDKLLAGYPQILAVNKMDLPESEANFERIKSKYESKDLKVFPISAASNIGLAELIRHAYLTIKDIPDRVFEVDYEKAVVDPAQIEKFHIEKLSSDYFVITGHSVERMIKNTNVDTEKGLHFMQQYLKEKGISAELDSLGIEEGDTVSIYGVEFDYFD